MTFPRTTIDRQYEEYGGRSLGVETRLQLYVRTTGDDNNDGLTIPTAFRTVKRAIQACRLFPDYDRYFIDCTGITESFNDYNFPAFKGQKQQVLNFTPPVPELLIESSINIYAVATQVYVTATGSVVQSPKSKTQTITPTVSPGWTVDEMKGKLCRGAGFANWHAVTKNDANSFEISRGATSNIPFPVEIIEPSAVFTTEFTGTAATPYLMLIAGCEDYVSFSGIKFTHNGARNPLATVFDRSSQTEFNSCIFEGGVNVLGLTTIARNWTACVWRRRAGETLSRLTWAGALNLRQSFVWTVDVDLSTGMPGNLFLHSSVIDNSQAIANRGLTSQEAIAIIFVSFTLIRNARGNGISIVGQQQNRIRSTEIYDCAGDAIAATGPGFATMNAVGGSGNTGRGLKNEHGHQFVAATDVDVTGLAGEILNASTSQTWALFHAAPSLVDLTQLCRVYRP